MSIYHLFPIQNWERYIQSRSIWLIIKIKFTLNNYKDVNVISPFQPKKALPKCALICIHFIG